MVSRILRTSLQDELPEGDNPLRISVSGLQVFVAAQIPAARKDLLLAVGDQSADVAAGATQVTFRIPFAMTVTEVRASLTTASSSGAVQVDINEGVSSILSTVISVDQDDTTSLDSATPAVISDPDLSDDAEITVDVDAAGTGAVGLKVVISGVLA